VDWTRSANVEDMEWKREILLKDRKRDLG